MSKSPAPNIADKVMNWLSPEKGLKRMQARKIQAYYEAAKPDRTRKFHRDTGGPNIQVAQGAVAIRNQARHLEQNHDISRGILRTLMTNIVGPKGIGIEPQPRTKDGKIHKEYAAALLEAWHDWQKNQTLPANTTGPASSACW